MTLASAPSLTDADLGGHAFLCRLRGQKALLGRGGDAYHSGTVAMVKY